MLVIFMKFIDRKQELSRLNHLMNSEESALAVKSLERDNLHRLTGVKRTTFDKMVGILEQSIKTRKTIKGRKKKLSIENMLLMTLEYTREYKTYFHISQSYLLSQSK